MRRSLVAVLLVGCGSVNANHPDGATQDTNPGPDGPPPKAPTFTQPAHQINTSYGLTGGLTVADFNSDGKPDIAAFDPATGANGGTVTTFISDGHGAFPTVTNGTPSASTAVAIGAGLIGGTAMGTVTANMVNQISTYAESGTDAVDYITNYSLSFPDTNTGQAIALAPLDGMVKPWIVEGTSIGLIVAQPAAGQNYTIPGSKYLAGVSVTGVALDKIASTSVPDVAAVGTDGTGSHAYVLANNGSGAFGLPQTMSVTGTPVGVAIGDVDGGGADIVVATTDHIAVYLNQGGTLQTMPAHSYAAQSTVTAIVLADFNGDGKLDVAVSCTGADEVLVYTGNGDGSFNSPPAVFGAGQTVHGIAVADFNGDTKPDIAVSGGFGIEVLLNTTP